MAEGRGPGSIDWSQVDLSAFGFPRGRRGRPTSRVGFVIGILVLLFFLVPLLIGPLVTFLTDLLWFRSVGLEDVYLRRYTASFWAFLVFFFAFFVLAAPNLYAALRPQVTRVVIDASRPRARPLVTTLRLLPLLLIPSFAFGLTGSAQWDPLLRWLNAIPFGVTDPVFGRDVGFYFFTLPVLDFLRGWLIGAVVLIALGVLGIYVVRGVVGVATAPLARGDLAVAGRTALALARPARAHLSILGGLFLALVAGGYVLDQFDLLFRDEGVLTGIGYTSANARLPGLVILSVVVGIAALACFANAFVRTLWILVGAIGVWIVASVLLLAVYPSLVDAIVVKPDQLNKERPYIARNIAATRAAFGLGNIDETAFNVVDNPTAEVTRRELGDVSTVRLWDYRPLLDAYQQLQGLRQYYAFQDVDVDRYQVNGVERPVMLSARELDQNKLPREARTWVNLHLFYTHGFGAALTPVGGVTPEGLPVLQLRDIPLQGEPKVDQPRIYYGQLTSNYAIVQTSQDEFDYAQENGDAKTRFSGGGGVRISTLWDRILFSLRFADFNLFASTQITGDSRMLFNREIESRARLVAPFLSFDRDPYVVISGGKIYWIQDAYTTGSRYPYSKLSGSINYIRNSVKVVTDAYDGTVTFYVIDDTDPVVRTLRAIYPTLFAKSVADMPADLRAHLRYPEDLFRRQVDLFSTYHMTDPDEFYSRGDAWRIASEIFQQGAAAQPIEPYYVTTQMPGATHKEFVLFVPMTPAGNDRNNMVSWIAGRADAPEYGKLRVLRFPKDRNILGPLQIENRFDTDTAIRQQITLLGGGGASVIRGNLLVLPVGDSFLYVEPLFVQANQGGRIPELKRVIVATQDKIAMEDTFPKALDQIFGAAAAPTPGGAPPGPAQPPTAPGASPTPRPSPGAAPVPADVGTLVKQASDQYQRAQDALKAGDFAEYGRQIKLLEDTLARLRAATGQ